MSETSQRALGRIQVHPRGFGFLSVTAGDEVTSAFVAPPDLNRFFADDVVEATITRGTDGRFTAKDLQLRERPRTLVFGEVVSRGGQLFLHVDREVSNTDWALDASPGSVAVGDRALARVGDGRLALFQKLEKGGDHSLERVVARYAIPFEVAPEVISAAEAARTRPHTLGGRRDLRDVPTITVDAASTRDIDDAVSVLPADADGGLRLLVSIADVAEYVEEGSVLDRAARERATSVYLANRVLNMLPESLSSEHLSLLPNAERSCLTVELRLDAEGNVLASDVYESLIRSFARCTYTEVAAYLDKGEVSQNLEPVRAALPWLRAASARLAVARARRGGVQIESDEARLTFDSEGEVSGVVAEPSTSAHTMIERFMVAANEGIASFLAARGVPAPFRVQDRPDPQRVADLAAFAENSGFATGFGKELSPLALAAFDRQISGSASEPALRAVLRRALGFARYTATPTGHFGLAAPLYLHFTSPIRRYADLFVHRTIKRYLHGKRDFTPGDTSVAVLSEHLNGRARAADRAERDRRRMLLARYMRNRVGDRFSARITRVTPFGLLAQLDGMRVEGLVPADALPNGPYRPDARQTRLSNGTRSFAVGAPIVVKVASTDEELGRVELSLEP